MTKLTFLGAARTVTGSKYLLDVGGQTDSRRLRSLSGSQAAEAAKLGSVAVRAGGSLCGCADACAPGSHGLSAPSCGRRLSREGVLHARHGRSLQAGASGFGQAAGRRCARGQQAQLLETPSCAAAVSRVGRVPGAVAVPVRRLRQAVFADRWRRHRVHQRGPSPWVVVHQDVDQERPDDSVRRRPGPLFASGAAGSVTAPAGRRAAPRIDLWRSDSRARRSWGTARRHHQGHDCEGGQSHHPGFRDRAGGRGALLDQETRG